MVRCRTTSEYDNQVTLALNHNPRFRYLATIYSPTPQSSDHTQKSEDGHPAQASEDVALHFTKHDERAAPVGKGIGAVVAAEPALLNFSGLTLEPYCRRRCSAAIAEERAMAESVHGVILVAI